MGRAYERGIIVGTVIVFLAWMSGAFAADVRLAWEAPVSNTDGTPLTDLAGYKVSRGAASLVYTETRDVGNVTNYLWTGLAGGTLTWVPTYTASVTSTTMTITWPTPGSIAAGMTNFFAGTAVNTSGVESDYSTELAYQVPAPVADNFTARWGTLLTQLTNTVVLGAVPVFSGVRSAFPRTTLYFACVEDDATNAAIVAVNNRKPKPPKAMRVQ